jgi:CDP-glucose 4,6-dehydratase
LIADALASFYRNRRVLITGHTGLKGSWLLLWLQKLGATTFGVALPPETPRSMFSASGLASPSDRFVDIRNLADLRQAFQDARPEIVFHLAAQPIVGLAHRDPLQTFETNVMGTAHVLECLRSTPSVAAAVMVSSDKCYQNVEQMWGYREQDRLGGGEPYGASKAAMELAVWSWAETYFSTPGTANIASARAGNVVGGGDWSEFRLVPDCIRSLRDGVPIQLRNPRSTRPWQFVLEPLTGYLLLGKHLVEEGKAFQEPWNFGPALDETYTVEQGAQAVVNAWGAGSIRVGDAESFKEHVLLQVDSTKARRRLGWRPVLDFQQTMQVTADWYRQQHRSADGPMHEYSLGQLVAYENHLNQPAHP